MKLLALVVVGGLAAVLIWGVFVEPHLIDREDEVGLVPGLPSAWEGRRVALVADFQVGMLLANTGTIERIVEDIVDDRPAVALIGGDFLYHAAPNPYEDIHAVVELVRPLPAAGIPTYAVFGSHDYGMGSRADIGRRDLQLAQRLEQALEGAGVRVLRNEVVALAPPGAAEQPSPLYLVGIGSFGAELDEPAAAVAQVPAEAPRLVLMHNPESFEDLPPGTAPLAMAGNTHGGQIRVPSRPEWSYLALVRDDEVTVDGWIDDYGQPGNRLYVNRGIGFSIIPMRINCPPELTMFTLTGSAV